MHDACVKTFDLTCALVGAGKEICTNGVGGLFCTGVLRIAPARFLNTTYVCNHVLGFCQDFTIYIRDFARFRKSTLRNTPPPAPTRKSSSRALKVALVTDIHIDFYYAANSRVDCSVSSCCRVDSGAPRSDADRAGVWGTLGRCDVPERTVLSGVQFLAREVRPDMVLWTGDSMESGSYNASKELITRSMLRITEMFKRELAHDVPVFPILGNHEGYPVDNFDFEHPEAEDWLTGPTAEVWGDWLGPEAIQEYKARGFYTMTVPGRPRLRVVGLNSLLYAEDNLLTFINSTDPLGQIRWLESVLALAEQQGERVLVLSHFPTCCERSAEGYLILTMTFI